MGQPTDSVGQAAARGESIGHRSIPSHSVFHLRPERSLPCVPSVNFYVHIFLTAILFSFIYIIILDTYMGVSVQ